MFLALSKILPLFIYPLGLSIVLCGIAAIAILRGKAKTRSWAGTLIVVAICILLVSSSRPVSDALVRSLEWQNIPERDLPVADAIVVLGGGIRPQIHPRPWVEVAEAGDRIIYGARLWKAGKAPLLIVSGGRAEWLGEGGNPESEDMAAIATLLGVPSTAVIQDATSLNTRENAVNVQAILSQKSLRKILLVTSALHMPRSLAIFRKLGIDAIAAPTDFLTVSTDNAKGFVGTLLDLLPEAEALKNTTNALKELVGIIIYRLVGWA
ncbi:YdcF family protein [Pseudanabaena sp. PCC 6802]|uniref:YdcF family protein n=1 Tax=Pseudanabaena sp. PCC 6802 TaxID=118173 RepID=UPI00034817C9|nr:YdcF family protein [Pseudanabaena sp. PCC 6802]